MPTLTLPNAARRPMVTGLCIALGCIGALAVPCHADDAKFQVFMDNGKQLEGDKIERWSDGKTHPKLEDNELLDGKHRALLIRRKARRPKLEAPFIRFKNGDVIPGKLSRISEADRKNDAEQSPLQSAPSGQRLKIIPGQDLLPVHRELTTTSDQIESVVRTSQAQEALEPGMVILSDGRQFRPEAIRWTDAGLRILLEEQMLTIPLRELAGLKVASPNRTEHLIDQATMPGVGDDARIGRIFTERGGVFTFWSDELRIDHWKREYHQPTHYIQPVWAGTPIEIHYRSIAAWSYQAPDQLPLALMPVESRSSDSPSGFDWPWRVNRNVRGDVAAVGKHSSYLAIGTHAPSQLKFKLPESAKRFSTWFGLDEAVEDGGYVNLAVFAGKAKGKPDWSNDGMTGKDDAKRIEKLNLDDADSLTLKIDPASSESPEDADPLDIRDEVSWLRPLVAVKRPQAKQRTNLARLGLPPNGWSFVSGESEKPEDGQSKDRPEEPIELQFDRWYGQDTDHKWHTGMRLSKKGFTLGRMARITPQTQLLVCEVQTGEDKRNVKLTLRAQLIEASGQRDKKGEAGGKKDKGEDKDDSKAEDKPEPRENTEQIHKREIEKTYLSLHPWIGRRARLSLHLAGEHGKLDATTPVALRTVRLVPIIRDSKGESPKPDVSLWDLEPTDASHTDYDDFSVPDDAAKTTYTWFEREFKGGFKTKDGLSLTYAVKPEYQRFVAVVKKQSWQSCPPVQVLIDGEEAYRMPHRLKYDRPVQIDVPIPPGSQTLTLTTKDDDGHLSITRAGFMAQ